MNLGLSRRRQGTQSSAVKGLGESENLEPPRAVRSRAVLSKPSCRFDQSVVGFSAGVGEEDLPGDAHMVKVDFLCQIGLMGAGRGWKRGSTLPLVYGWYRPRPGGSVRGNTQRFPCRNPGNFSRHHPKASFPCHAPVRAESVRR